MQQNTYHVTRTVYSYDFMAGLLTYRDNPNLTFPALKASGSKIQLYLQLREQLWTYTSMKIVGMHHIPF